MANWDEIELFNNTDLYESYVLGWDIKCEQLQFDLDLYIIQGHAKWTPPGPREFARWIRAKLIFPKVRNLVGLRTQYIVKPAVDADGENDYGEIDELIINNSEVSMIGEFGILKFTSGVPYILYEV
jgi:hypothetical protein